MNEGLEQRAQPSSQVDQTSRYEQSEYLCRRCSKVIEHYGNTTDGLNGARNAAHDMISHVSSMRLSPSGRQIFSDGFRSQWGFQASDVDASIDTLLLRLGDVAKDGAILPAISCASALDFIADAYQAKAEKFRGF